MGAFRKLHGKFRIDNHILHINMDHWGTEKFYMHDMDKTYKYYDYTKPTGRHSGPLGAPTRVYAVVHSRNVARAPFR